MAMIEQEIDPVLLGLNRVAERTRPDDREVADSELVAAGRARVGAHLAGDCHRCLECELGETIPHVSAPRRT